MCHSQRRRNQGTSVVTKVTAFYTSLIVKCETKIFTHWQGKSSLQVSIYKYDGIKATINTRHIKTNRYNLPLTHPNLSRFNQNVYELNNTRGCEIIYYTYTNQNVRFRGQ